MATRKKTTGTMPPQRQKRQPGRQSKMHPVPVSIRDGYRGSGKLQDKVALISGGDSGICRAVAVHFAREGADVAIVYLEEDADAKRTRQMIEAEDRECLLIAADLSRKAACDKAVARTVRRFGRIDVLVNNIAEQHPVEAPERIDEKQLDRTFRTNLYSYVFLTQAALEHMPEGSTIINTGSVTGTRGHRTLIDYSATKGAIQTLTFSLARALAGRKIRVNAVAPGPIWTPLIPASFSREHVARFGRDTLLERPGQPAEVAPAYVYLASADGSYVTGQVIHVNGGAHIGA